MYRQTFEGERIRTRADEGSGKQESVTTSLKRSNGNAHNIGIYKNRSIGGFFIIIQEHRDVAK